MSNDKLTSMIIHIPELIEFNPNIIREYSELEFSGDIQQMVVLEEQNNCCARFLDFFENHLIPFVENNINPPEGSTKKQQMENQYRFIDYLVADNCEEAFADLRKMKLNGGVIPQDGSIRYVGNVMWWLEEFEKCLNGEDFDFSDYNLSSDSKRIAT